jgi:type I restriction enzyme S subunit
MTVNQIAEASSKYLTDSVTNEVPVGYKLTEVGIIPEDWQAVNLGEVSDVRMCKRILAEQTQKVGPIPFYKIGTFGGEPDAFIPNSLYEEFTAKFSFPKKGDVLISAAGTLGKTVVYDGKPAYFQDSNIVWLDIDNKKLINDYLYQYYNVIRWASSEGSTIARLYNGIIRASLIALPPHQEQTAIANALSDVDALIQELEKLITKKQAIKTATMQQLLTGRTRLPQFAHHPDGRKKGYKPSAIGNIPEDWEVRPLSDLSTYINDGTHHTPKYVQQGVPFYSVENVTANDFTNVKYISLEEHKKLIRRCLPEKGDILMTRIGTLGITRLIDWDIDASIYVSLALIKLKSVVDSKYVYIFSKSEIFFKEVEKRSLVNATPQKINMNEIGQVPIAFPTDKEEQSKISIVLSDALSEIQILENRLNKTRQIKQGMMQELLTGKTRLKS